MLKSALAALLMLVAPAAALAAPAQASVLPQLLELAQKEARAGDSRAKAYLELQRAPAPDKATAEQGAKWLLAKAGDGVPAAQFMLAIVLEERHPPEFERARGYYEKAAAQGYVPAMTRLAIFYEHGRGGPADKAKALEWAMKAAKAGDSDAQAFVGATYVEGKTVARDIPTAVAWLEKAGEQGDSRAAFILASLYASGDGVPKDEQRAKYWLAKKRTADHAKVQPTAQEKAARAKALGRDPNAGSLFDAADLGDAGAQARIGYLFLEGKTYPQDFDQAAYYLAKAAEAGDPGGLINLGSMHAKGLKFAKDEAEAGRWYRKAADKGVPEGQYRYGLYLLEGRGGLKRDPAEAARLLRLAADRGHKGAQQRLAALKRAPR